MNKTLLVSSLLFEFSLISMNADPSSPLENGSVPIVEPVPVLNRDLIDPDTGERVFDLAPFIVRPHSFSEEQFFVDTKKHLQDWQNQQILSDFKKFSWDEGGVFKKIEFGEIDLGLGLSWTKKNKAEWALLRIRW